MQENIRKEIVIVPNQYLESYTIGHLSREGYTINYNEPYYGVTTITR